ncbi:MAG: VacJ [Alysiella sp.]|uniref:VacJ n=1 Tax=Alysiella sp. TaxID=1872483 RepID=UPI0026DCFFFE|nr:VacJ [Alysiella sp.]MDO4433200.1 VacJ [Alysiella sp.]
MYEVNRSVFIVIPREPFWNWLNSLPHSDLSGITLADLQQDANSYLVPACENADEVWEQIQNRASEIFAAELADWCDDDSYWPDLHPDIFGEWFDIVLSSIVSDLSSEPLQREAFQDIHI